MDAIQDYGTNQTPYLEGLIKRWQQQTLERDKHPDAPSDNNSPHLTEAKRPARARTKKRLSSHPRTGYGDRSSDGMTILPPSEETTSSLAMHRILQRDNPFNTIRKDLRRGSEHSSGDEVDSNQYNVLEPSFGLRRGRRSSSAGSAGSCGSDASGNSDPKSLTANLPDFYETSKVGKHWRRGGEILSRLKKTRQSGSVLYLDLTIEYLALATRKMNLNAKAWSAMERTLSRHSGGLETGWYFLDGASHIEEYTKLLEDVIAAWIYTVDPSIQIPYDDLPPHEKPNRFPQDRNELFLFTHLREMKELDEDAIYEQAKRLDDAYKTMIRELSK